ncbi:hypothetical protein DICPUDRAFT_149168 [Dictyostelium purpureum]|uniref:BZIP domain-containing protein n=1 Tax=Dictyostelium purpureum TaxID=5786 RepID=F0ZD08_DICPU|nr:uncharacterized protein DICPUDRAFT_149168 [Dictyostelium purpureum]EGC38185.1 hypothetical protein DICPUDRAFT_149168 [Dictyostelium purpureum]|eukprot:XP_003285312.1 hypothetical protein DICPUDRAFT_149168 [Dictyostelium purpureum]
MDYIDSDLSLVMDENSKQNILMDSCQDNNSSNNNINNSNYFLQDDIVCEFFSVGDIDITQNNQEITHNDISHMIEGFNTQNDGSSPSSPMRVPNCNSSPFNGHHTGVDSSPELVYDINVQELYNQQQQQQILITPTPNQLLDCSYQLFNAQQTVQLQDPTEKLQQDTNILNLLEQNIELPMVDGYSVLLSESPSSSSASPLTTPSSPGSPYSNNSTTLTTTNTSKASKSKVKDDKKSNSKKRTIESRVQNIVHPLTREELLKISGKEPVQIEDTPIHNEHDEKVVKKQRRLIKNRESAQLSRMRKKIYIEDLEKKISDLTQDNNSLKEEVLYLQGLVKQLANNNPDVNINYNSNLNNNNSNNSNNSSIIEINTNSVNNNNNHKQQQTKNVKAAGVCLLLIFFSLGVFFQTPQSQPQFGAITPFDVSPTTAKSSHNILSIENGSSNPKTISISDSSPSNYDIQMKTPSILLSNNNNNNIGSDSVNNIKSIKSNNININNNNNNIKNENNKRMVTDDSYQQQQQQNRKKIKINVGSRFEEIEDSPVIPVSTTTSLSIPQDLDDFHLVEEDDEPNQEPNSQFIVCSDSPRIVSHNITQTTENLLNSTANNPLTIGLLLPAESLNLNIGGERSILEISCLVSNIRVWNPLSVDSPSSSNSQQQYITNTNFI